MTAYHADHAWLGPGRGDLPGGDEASPGSGPVAADVLIETAGDRIAAVRTGVPRPADAVHLSGLTLPGLANAHSHAFHRALRGRTHAGAAPRGGTFWTWREEMYRVAARLDPDTYHAVARAAFGEMALAGIACVGEFHYLHHRPGGRPYADPLAMADALVEAAAEAGIRLTLLDTCYLAGGVGTPLQGPQLRFGDGTAERWAARAAALHDRYAGRASVRVGAAAHSVRAVPPPGLRVVAAWAAERAAPLHIHVSEQPAENDDCLAGYGVTPTALLDAYGVLGPRTTAVHATHLTASDVAALARTGTTVCATPTTERDLGDGLGPARALAVAGVPVALGSDSNAVVDLLEEARGLELHERLRSGSRGHWTAGQLLTAATAAGHASLGWPEAGRLEVGALADLTTVGLGSVRVAGAAPGTLAESVVFAGSAADVTHLVVGGRTVVSGGRHQLLGDVSALLRAAVPAALGAGGDPTLG